MSNNGLTNHNPNFEVHFEPGMHLTTGKQLDKLTSRIENGNPNANDWNEAVTKRISNISPSVIAVDGLEILGADAKDYTPLHKEVLWSTLPDRPSRLNSSDSIFAITGDNIYGGRYINGRWDTNATEFAIQIGSLAATYAAASILGGFLDDGVHGWRRWYRGYDPDSGDFDEEAASQISRRTFFKTLGAGAALLTFRGSALPSALAAISPFEPLTHAAEIFTVKTEFLQLYRRLGVRTYIDGRTALLIAKTFDALNDISGTNGKGVVVMGNAHIPFSDKYLEDDHARAHAIYRHTVAMLKDAITKPFYADEDEDTTVADRQEGVIDAEKKYVLFEVKEPDDNRFKKDPYKEMDRIVQFRGIHVATSVAAAIKDLKPGRK